MAISSQRSIPHCFRRILLTLLISVLSSSFLQAAEVQLDLKKSWIRANAKATGHSFEAAPTAFDCKLSTDEAHKLSGAQFSCMVLSMKTGKEKRDKEMWHWLESEKFGSVTFVMKALHERGTKLIMVGTLTLHDVQKQLEIPVTYKNLDGMVELSGEVTLDTTQFTLPIIRKMAFLTVDPKVVVSFAMIGKE